MNPLKLIPWNWRKIGYALLALAGLSITGLNAGYLSIGPIPDWLLFVSAFYTAVSGPSFAVANQNVKKP